jgi:hypothetical protein
MLDGILEKSSNLMDNDTDIESYWEDIRVYPVNPIIQLRAEDMARKSIAEEMGVDPKDYSHVTFDRFVEVMQTLRASRIEAREVALRRGYRTGISMGTSVAEVPEVYDSLDEYTQRVDNNQSEGNPLTQLTNALSALGFPPSNIEINSSRNGPTSLIIRMSPSYALETDAGPDDVSISFTRRL